MAEGTRGEKENRWNWLLWWRIDEAELEKQVSQYSSLKFVHSIRGISVLCLAFSIAITVAFVAFGALGLDASAYVDAGIMAALALFIYLGHRWAMLVAMAFWTLEKVLLVAGGVGTAQPNGGLVVGQIIWWCTYMHAFYFAFRVEQKRRELAKAAII